MSKTQTPNSKVLGDKALKFFHAKKYAEALPIFEEVAKNSDNSNDWFNVATTAVLCKEIEKGQNALNNAINLFNKHPNSDNLAVGQMSFYFMHALCDANEFDLAFAQLAKFKEVLSELKITDDHFLYMRGLPFLGDLLRASKVILENQKVVDSVAWLNALANDVDAEGKTQIEDFMKENGFVG